MQIARVREEGYSEMIHGTVGKWAQALHDLVNLLPGRSNYQETVSIRSFVAYFV